MSDETEDERWERLSRDRIHRPLPKRFYKSVTVTEQLGIALDGRTVKTPLKAALILPTPSLAEAVAAEWDAQVGVINPNETIHYVINAVQGQMLSIKLTAPVNEVAIGVNGPTGLILKPLDASPSWNTTVTTGGDHYINIMSLTGGTSKAYTLEVSLTGATATATSTNTPTTPAP